MRRLVRLYGEGKWCWVARDWNSKFGTTPESRRSSKQCRERWIHHLRPDINKKVRTWLGLVWAANGPGFPC